MDNKVVFFHVKNIRSREDYTLKPGDEVSFILDEYDKGVIDVQLLPTLSVLPSTSETVAQVVSYQSDESWETVDSEKDEPDAVLPSGEPDEVKDIVQPAPFQVELFSWTRTF